MKIEASYTLFGGYTKHMSKVQAHPLKYPIFSEICLVLKYIKSIPLLLNSEL